VSSHELTVQRREVTGKEAAKKLRQSGLVPAVAYGHKEEPVKLTVNAKELRDLLAHHGSHGMLTLKSSDGGADETVIIKSLQKHPFKPYVNSVDFLRVSMNEEITTTVPIHLEGEPVSVRAEGGVLVQALHEIEISAFPQNLPEVITVDVSELIMDGPPIHVRELTLPQGVKVLTDGEEAVAVVNHPKIEETETEPQTDEDPAAVEAIHGGDGDEATES
jgi:large subunit ribosomal protein L25